MDITERTQGGIVILTLNGRLDTNTSSSLETKFGQLSGAGNKQFVFELTGLDYVSSAGLRIFLVAAKKLKAVGGKLALAGMSANVKEVFDMSGFSSIFAIYPGEADAIAALS